jgi:hypothetical protein
MRNDLYSLVKDIKKIIYEFLNIDVDHFYSIDYLYLKVDFFINILNDC